MSEVISALAGARSEGFVTVQDAGLWGMISVRADLTVPGVVKALAGAGVTVPDVRMMSEGPVRAAWMGPDELLVLTGYDEAPALAESLASALGGEHALVQVVSDARAVLRLEGRGAGEVLAKLCPIDVERLAPAEIRRTRLAQVAAALWLEGADTAHVICFRSVAGYVFEALRMAARPGSEVGVIGR